MTADRSYWEATARPGAPRPSASGTIRAEVAILGAGYTGLSAALHLARAGREVVVIEAGRAGAGASGRNGGQVHSGQRLDQVALERMLGEAAAMDMWRLAEQAKALVRGLVAEHAIACDLRPGLVHAEHRADQVAGAHAHARHLAARYGYRETEPLDQAGLSEIVGSADYFGGVIDHGGMHLHPLNFVRGLGQAAEAAGARIFEGSRVIAVEGDGPVVLRTGTAEIRADFALLAGDAGLEALVPEIGARIAVIEAHQVATATLDADMAASVLSREVAVSDSRHVVNYFRLTPDRRLIFGGGESFGAARSEAVALPAMLRVFPQLAGVAIEHAWSGKVALTRRRLPYLTRRGRLYAATGYSGQGLATATFAGALVAEAIGGDGRRFEAFSRLPCPAFPGGRLLKRPLVAAALSLYALRDRL